MILVELEYTPKFNPIFWSAFQTYRLILETYRRLIKRFSVVAA
jgi:hypothetical protein